MMDLFDDAMPIRRGLPRLLPRNEEHRWYFYMDCESNYRKLGHPIYGEHDITYRFNQDGYRGHDFGRQGDIKILSIGCSWAFGFGVPQEHIFHEVFAERIRERSGKTVVNWNLSSPGDSADYVARVLHMTVSQLDPDIVLILFPMIDRREYIEGTGRRLHYIANAIGWDETWRAMNDHHAALSSHCDDQLNFYRNYKSIESLLHDKLWIFGLAHPEQYSAVESHLDVSRWAKWPGALLDVARDHAHPGPATHHQLADAFWERYTAIGKILAPR